MATSERSDMSRLRVIASVIAAYGFGCSGLAFGAALLSPSLGWALIVPMNMGAAVLGWRLVTWQFGQGSE
jgi:hypothetical protein